MRIPYPKPHLPIPDQLALLQQRGMAVADPARAERHLGRLGYYRLSGYWYPARQVTLQSNPNGTVTRHVEDTFRPGTTFERAVDLYVFDKRLRMLCMDALDDGLACNAHYRRAKNLSQLLSQGALCGEWSVKRLI